MYTELKLDWTKQGPACLEGKLCEVSEEDSQRNGDILQEVMLRARAIPSMLDDVVQELLSQSV